MRYAVFDIETRIDKSLVRAIYYPEQPLTDQEAYERVQQQLLGERGGGFFPVSFHVPIAIAWGTVGDDLALASVEMLGTPTYAEAELVREFWARVEAFEGVLVSFNGRGFDLPVLELHALRLGISAPRYFNERQGRRHRYSEKHYDLYDFITNMGMYRVRGGLNLLARLIGLPGKTTVSGGDVQDLWEAGDWGAIQRYCRRDVIQTYLLLLRVEVMRGRIRVGQLERLWEAAQPWCAELV